MSDSRFQILNILGPAWYIFRREPPTQLAFFHWTYPHQSLQSLSSALMPTMSAQHINKHKYKSNLINLLDTT